MYPPNMAVHETTFLHAILLKTIRAVRVANPAVHGHEAAADMEIILPAHTSPDGVAMQLPTQRADVHAGSTAETVNRFGTHPSATIRRTRPHAATRH